MRRPLVTEVESSFVNFLLTGHWTCFHSCAQHGSSRFLTRIDTFDSG